MDKGLDTVVGSGGSQLSGGQKQRISIARSLLTEPSILLLDEATSALDRKNEREIHQTLEEVSKGMTTIMVAHRLSTVVNADRILVLDEGAIVEEGTHQELLEKKGKYYELVNSQIQDDKQSDQNGPDGGSKIQEKERNEVREKVADIISKEEKKEMLVKELQVARKEAKRMGAYLKGNRLLLCCGLVAAVFTGALMPTFAMLVADMVTVLAKFETLTNLGVGRESEEWIEVRRESLNRGMYFIIISIGGLVLHTLNISIFNLIGQRVTSKLRIDLFRHFVTRDMEFFDHPKNSPGDLTVVLSRDCMTVNTLVSTSYGSLLNGFGSIACGVLIAMLSSWKLALVCLACRS